jgi:hypothetical protein
MPDFSGGKITPVVTVQQEQVSELIKQVKERDFVAFECLYLLYKKFVWERLSYLLGNQEIVNDISRNISSCVAAFVRNKR